MVLDIAKSPFDFQKFSMDVTNKSSEDCFIVLQCIAHAFASM